MASYPTSIKPEDNTVSYSDAIVAMIFILIILVETYIFNHLKTTPQKKYRNKSLMLIPILILGIIIASSSYASVKLYEDLEAKKQFIDDVKEEQMKLDDDIYYPSNDFPQDQSEFDPNSSESDPSFEDKNPKKVAIVGYYQADKPLYLKTNVFSIQVNNYDLYIYQPYGYSNYYKNKKLANIDDSSLVKIIYATSGRYLPTTNSITEISESYYYEDLGLLGTEYQKDTTRFYEFYYSDLKESSKNTDRYSYIYVSPYSDRYDEIQELTQEITKNVFTVREKAIAVEKYLQDNYEYTLNPGFEDKVNPIDDFILDTKKGYCTQFATAMTVMLETIDIDSRVVGGFAGNTYDPNIGAYLLLNTDLHALVEVAIPNEGFVTYDPTTSNLASDMVGSGDGGASIDSRGDLYKTEIEYVLQSVDPEFSFDDVYEEKDVNKVEETLEEKKETEEEIQKKLEEQEKEIERENQIEKVKRTFELVVYGVIVLVILCGGIGAIGFMVYKLRNHKPDMIKNIRKRARYLDMLCRKLVAKENNEKLDSFVDLKIVKLVTKTQYKEQVKEACEFADKVIYSPTLPESAKNEVERLIRVIDGVR